MPEPEVEQKNRVTETFRKAQEGLAKFVSEHVGDTDFAEDRLDEKLNEWLPMTDEIRVELLELINRALEKGMLSPDEHTELEFAIGMNGSAEHGGWPETTPGYQKAAVAAWASWLSDDLRKEDTAADIAERVKTKLAEDVSKMELWDKNGKPVIVQLGMGLVNPGSVPKEVIEAFLDKKQQEPKPEPEDDKGVDWTSRGYL